MKIPNEITQGLSKLCSQMKTPSEMSLKGGQNNPANDGAVQASP